MILSQERRFRIDVYERSENGIDESGCTIYDNIYKGRVWGQIITAGSKENSYDGNFKDYEITHKIRVRKDIYQYKKGMYMVYSGYKYEVVCVQPMYSQPELVELGCKMVVEE